MTWFGRFPCSARRSSRSRLRGASTGASSLRTGFLTLRSSHLSPRLCSSLLLAAPQTLPLVCAVVVSALGIWTGISAIWSPAPALARNEFLLSLLYAFLLLLPALTAANCAKLSNCRHRCHIRARRERRRHRAPGSLRHRTRRPLRGRPADRARVLRQRPGRLLPRRALARTRRLRHGAASTLSSAPSRSVSPPRCSPAGSARRARAARSPSPSPRFVVFAAVPGRLRLLVPALCGGCPRRPPVPRADRGVPRGRRGRGCAARRRNRAGALRRRRRGRRRLRARRQQADRA